MSVDLTVAVRVDEMGGRSVEMMVGQTAGWKDETTVSSTAVKKGYLLVASLAARTADEMAAELVD